MGTDMFSVKVSSKLLDRARDAVAQHQGSPLRLTMRKVAESAVRREIQRAERERGSIPSRKPRGKKRLEEVSSSPRRGDVISGGKTRRVVLEVGSPEDGDVTWSPKEGGPSRTCSAAAWRAACSQEGVRVEKFATRPGRRMGNPHLSANAPQRSQFSSRLDSALIDRWKDLVHLSRGVKEVAEIFESGLADELDEIEKKHGKIKKRNAALRNGSRVK